jgi:arsenate reductase (thioredoxin)
MIERTYDVLFLCTGNSARSILAEGILRKDGEGRFTAYSAGSQPKGMVNPLALKVLGAHGYPIDGYRSKTWNEFAAPGAPVMDVVLTVCDSAAGEVCPVWPGHPSIAHWGIQDPAAAEGSDADKEQAFVRSFQFLKSRIGTFVHLPLASLDRFTMGTRIQAVGHVEAASTVPAGGADPHQK